MKKTRREFLTHSGFAGIGLISSKYLSSLNASSDNITGESEMYKQKAGPVPKKFIPGGNDNSSDTLNVAAVQMHSSNNISENVDRINNTLSECASKGIRVAAFPECALTGYSEEVVKLEPEQIESAEKKVAETCKKANIYAIIGTAYRIEKKLFNSSTVISPSGSVIERYHKIQLAESWPDPGDHLSVFRIDGIMCSIIICHDERYPELVRLPALAGAKVIFYISHESPLRNEEKLNPYRAQIQARAVENTIYVVHANPPANQDASGSHGQSRIISPDGNIIQEASIFKEEVIASVLDLKKATGGNAGRSLTRGPLQDWWKEGLKYVKIIG
jgi:predicted amidohydrolase